MHDPGLNEAIRIAGGVSALARCIGISQPSVSNWDRVPVERIVAVAHVGAQVQVPDAPYPGLLRAGRERCGEQRD